MIDFGVVVLLWLSSRFLWIFSVVLSVIFFVFIVLSVDWIGVELRLSVGKCLSVVRWNRVCVFLFGLMI